MVNTLDLSTGYTPVAGKTLPYTEMQFSGGEYHIKIAPLQNNNTVVITCRAKSSSDIIKTLMAKNALDTMGVTETHLVIPYLPYARQDRICDEGEAFSLKVFCTLINSCNFKSVTVLDAHSDVGPALLDRCINISNTDYVLRAYHHINDIDSSDVILISPDAGANKKVNKLFVSTGVFSSLVKCDKVRDMKTGNLTGFEVFTDDLKGNSCLIVDDICDGGGTFIGIAEELKKKNAGNLYLFVTHGIFSKGLKDLDKVFKVVFSTDSFSDTNNKQFKTIFNGF